MGTSIEYVDEATQALVGWIGRVVPHVAVSVRSARETEPRDGITVRLLQVTPRARPRTAASPLELSLRYDVALQLGDPLAEQRAIGEIVFAALLAPDYQIDPAVRDGSCLTLVTRLARMRDVKLAPTPRRLRADVEPARAFEGVVLGPGARPIADALVAIGGTAQRMHTDRVGRFRFTAVPGSADKLKLTVWAMGRCATIDAAPGPAITIQLPTET
ncbi:carboxypeptidase-like regulatory domain-containing protein [Bradyrhizobium sp. SZCCHNS3051]|uniref:carboxypeptidase-like regulatory domain-containing protein n=1 Tax=Bradyrhizobium sp. SZCCHNS3051 TaxID=3057320 RepID=UPI002916AF78|nr:carboxypeptidase-like regulatory domain-containing protein [Bradyrhizobium sp. SZCCHNS3051]